jgi:hypothetical protein
MERLLRNRCNAPCTRGTLARRCTTHTHTHTHMAQACHICHGSCCVTAATADVLRRASHLHNSRTHRALWARFAIALLSARHLHNSRTHRVLWARFAARVVDSREAPLEARKQQAHPAPSSRSVPQRAHLQILFFCGSTKWLDTGCIPGRSFPDALMKRRALLLLLAGAGAAQTCAPWSVSRPPPRCRSPASRAEEVRGRGGGA